MYQIFRNIEVPYTGFYAYIRTVHRLTGAKADVAKYGSRIDPSPCRYPAVSVYVDLVHRDNDLLKVNMVT